MSVERERQLVEYAHRPGGSPNDALAFYAHMVQVYPLALDVIEAAEEVAAFGPKGSELREWAPAVKRLRDAIAVFEAATE